MPSEEPTHKVGDKLVKAGVVGLFVLIESGWYLLGLLAAVLTIQWARTEPEAFKTAAMAFGGLIGLGIGALAALIAIGSLALKLGYVPDGMEGFND